MKSMRVLFCQLSLCIPLIMAAGVVNRAVGAEPFEQTVTQAVDKALVKPIVSQLVIREMLPASKVTAGYFSLSNPSTQAITLTSVTSAVSNRIEIHQHVMSGGLMKMQQVTDGLTIAAGQTIQFQPHGYHLMVFEPQIKLKHKDNFTLVFNFTGADSVSVEGQILSILSMNDMLDKTRPQAGHQSHH